MQQSSITARFAATALLLTLTASAPPVQAAPPEPAITPTSTSGNGTSPLPYAESWIAPEDVADRADALSRLMEAGLTDTTAANISRISTGLKNARPTLEAAFDGARAAIQDKISLMSIQDARLQVESAGKDFPAWQEELSEASRLLTGLGTRLEQARGLWTRTRARPEVVAADKVVMERINQSLEGIETAAARISDLRVRVLALDDSIDNHDTDIRDTIHNLEEATRAFGSNLAVPDHAPLWRRGIADSLAAEWPQVPGALSEFHRSTVAYFETDSRPFLLQAVLVLVLVGLFHRMPGSLAQASFTQQVSQSTTRLLSRPYAMALLLALLSSPPLHPSAPRRVNQVIGILALFPVATILSLAYGRASWSFYAALLGLMLVDHIAMGLTALPTISLLIFLIEIVIGLSLCFAYRRRLGSDGSSPWLAHTLTIGMNGLVLALSAEIGGWSALASVIGRLILVGGMTGMLIGAATLSIEAIAAFAFASPLLRRSRFVNQNQALAHRWSSTTVRVVGTAFWLKLVATALGLRAIAGETLDAILDAGLTLGTLTISIGGTLSFVLTLGASMILSRAVHEMLEDDVLPRMNLPRGIPHALLTMANYAFWALGFLLALAVGGVQLSQLAILLGGFGVGIGMGLQVVVKNFAAGITLLLERRVHVDDTVEIASKNVFGRVLSIGLRASVVRNWNGTEVVMPNSDLVEGSVTNWTLSDPTHRIDVAVQVADSNDPEDVMKLLMSVAAADPALLREPAPSAQLLGFGPGTFDFRLKAWTSEDYERTAVHTSRLTLALFRALKDAGIRMQGSGR